MNRTILDKVLSYSRDTKTIIGLRKYGNDANLFVGFVINFNTTLVLLQQVTTFGLEDGLLVIDIVNIETIETEDNYLKAYQFLFKNIDKIKEQTVKELTLPEDKNWQYTLIKELSKYKKVITIELSDGTIVNGFITDFDENYLEFNSLNNIGEEEGKIIYKLSEISSFTIDELESRKRKAFFEWRHKPDRQ